MEIWQKRQFFKKLESALAEVQPWCDPDRPMDHPDGNVPPRFRAALHEWIQAYDHVLAIAFDDLCKGISTSDADFGDLFDFIESVIGKVTSELELAEEHSVDVAIANSSTKNVVEIEGIQPRVLVFLSHSAIDETLASHIVDLLCSALHLKKSDIRATSVPGCKHPGGSDTPEQLSADIRASKVVLGLLSSSAAASTWVLFELGAAWGLKRTIVPLAVGDASVKDLLSGPIADLNALKTSSRSDVLQMIYDIGKHLDRMPEPASAYDGQVQRVIEWRPTSSEFSKGGKESEPSQGLSDWQKGMYFAFHIEQRVYNEIELVINLHEGSSAGRSRWRGLSVEAMYEELKELQRKEKLIIEDFRDGIAVLRAHESRFE